MRTCAGSYPHALDHNQLKVFSRYCIGDIRDTVYNLYSGYISRKITKITNVRSLSHPQIVTNIQKFMIIPKVQITALILFLSRFSLMYREQYIAYCS